MKEPLDDDVRAWARSALAVGPGATPAEVRAAALRLVRGAGYAPPPDDAIAIGIALGRPRDAVEAFTREAYYSREEDALARAVDEFAHDFFDLAPAERKRTWTDLDRRSATVPWWRARLERLRDGLDIEKPAGTPSRLAAIALELFCLPPAERAARRRELLADRGAVGTMRDEVAEFTRSQPALAALCKDLLGELSGATRKPAPNRPASRASTRADSAPVKQTYAPPPQGRNWPSWVVVLAILMMVRLVAMVGCRDPGHNPNRGDFNVPKFNELPVRKVWDDPDVK